MAGTQAMGKLSYLLYPLCVAGAVYSLIYTPHRRLLLLLIIKESSLELCRLAANRTVTQSVIEYVSFESFNYWHVPVATDPFLCVWIVV